MSKQFLFLSQIWDFSKKDSDFFQKISQNSIGFFFVFNYVFWGKNHNLDAKIQTIQVIFEFQKINFRILNFSENSILGHNLGFSDSVLTA